MRNLTIAVAIFAAFALLGMRYVQDKPALTNAEIVATIDLTRQNAPIPETTLYTPTEDGVYRITSYLSNSRSGEGGFWQMIFRWHDDGGLESYDYAVETQVTPPNAYLCDVGCSQVVVAKARANTGIVYQIQGGQGQRGIYEAHIVVEKMN